MDDYDDTTIMYLIGMSRRESPCPGLRETSSQRD